MSALSSELETLSSESSERLCHILRGLFSCMQDLNARVATLETQCGSHGEN